MSQRDEFEKWCDRESIDARKGEHLTDVYRSPAARVAWRSWQASRAAALEEAAKLCDEMADNWNLQAQGARDGRYDFMAEAGDRCADEIRALDKSGGNRPPIDGNQIGEAE